MAGYPAMPPVYIATGLSVNSTIAYCSGAGVLPFPLPGVALAIPVSNAPNTNIVPIVKALALTRCADVASPPLIGEPSEDRRPPDVRRAPKELRQIELGISFLRNLITSSEDPGGCRVSATPLPSCETDE